MGFRIAIGSGRCADGIASRNSLRRELCARILARLDRLRLLTPDALAGLPAFANDVERIEGRPVTLSTYQDKLETGDALIVVQGFLHSWRSPTYFGAAGVGYMYAEGIMLGPDGRLREPDEDSLWPFR